MFLARLARRLLVPKDQQDAPDISPNQPSGGINLSQDLSGRANLLIEASNHASQRSRRVLMFSQVFGLIALVAILNGRFTSWIDVRRELAMGAQRFFRETDAGPRLIQCHHQGLSESECLDDLVAAVCPEDGGTGSGFATKYCLGIKRGKALAWSRGYLTEAEAEAEVGRWDRLNVEATYTVPVPLTGMRIDTNDFGLVGGLVHSVILAWLLMALRRERVLMRALHRCGLGDVSTWQNFFAEIKFKAPSKDEKIGEKDLDLGHAARAWLLATLTLGLIVLWFLVRAQRLVDWAGAFPSGLIAGAVVLLPFLVLSSGNLVRLPTLLAIGTPPAVWAIGLLLDWSSYGHLFLIFDSPLQPNLGLLTLVRDLILWTINFTVALMISMAFFLPEDDAGGGGIPAAPPPESAAPAPKQTPTGDAMSPKGSE